MATNALTCSASTLVSNNMVSKSLLPAGLGRHSVLPPTPSSKAPSSRPSLVVKAQLGGGSSTIEEMEKRHLLGEHPLKRGTSVETSPDVRTPWSTIEDDNELRMWVDMPGTEAQNIKVEAVNNLLYIKTNGGRDVYGNKIFSPRETKVYLPFVPNKKDIMVAYKNGVLYITVSKIRKEDDAIHIPTVKMC